MTKKYANRIVGSGIMNPADIKANPQNWRKHPASQGKALDEVLGSVGWIQEVIINKTTGNLIDGHLRVETALKNKETEIPVKYVELTEDEERIALATFDPISAMAEQDAEILKQLLADIESEDVDMTQFFGEDVLPKIEHTEEELEAVPEVPKVAKTKRGDMYKLGEHVLMCGDSTKAEDVARLMSGGKAALVFTDPPYGVSYRGVNNPGGRLWEVIENDDLRGEKLSEFLLAAFKNLKASLREKRAFYIWYASSNHLQFEHAIIDAGLKSKQVLFWNKGMILGHSDYHWAAEPCFYGCHEGENCEWFGDRCQTTVWDIKRDNTREYVHPTQKPTALAIKAIFNSSKAGETVLDLFGGSGSTLIACEQTNRVNCTMEFDPKYADVIRRRWAEFVHGEGCDWQALTPAVEE